MNREAALRKLRACLRMAASSNPNEAAVALRHAQALMDEYGLTQSDADDEFGDFGAPTRNTRSDLPVHLMMLVNAVARHFRCGSLMTRRLPSLTVEIRFVGPRTGAEVAAYAFTVLRRQMESDAGKHLRRVRKASNRVSRARTFGIGFVRAIERLLDVQNLSIEHEAKVARCIEQKYGETVSTKSREMTTKNWKSEDFHAGHRSGGKAQLNPGLKGYRQERLERLP